MVLPLLLTDPNTVMRYGDLGRMVLQSLHEIHSMERALSIFVKAIAYGESEEASPLPDSPLQSLSAFDPHVRDCSCHIRAQMLWDLVELYRKPENKELLLYAIDQLKRARVNAALFLEEIELGGSRKLQQRSRSAPFKYADIWERIEFDLFLKLKATDSHWKDVVTASGESAALLSTNARFMIVDTTSYSFTPASTLAPHRSAHTHRNFTIDATWNPRDIMSVARFLTLCNLLSESRAATVEAGPPMRVRISVNLQPVYERNARELEELYITSTRPLNFLRKWNNKLRQQTEAMQIYVSRVTAEWAKQTGMKVWSSFPKEFIATSDILIACVSSYVSLLLVENAWIKQDIPILAMIQHFCSHGRYRNIFYRITSKTGSDVSKNKHSSIFEDDGFQTDMTTLDQLSSAPWARTPHIVMVGTSCRGTIEDFKMHILESRQASAPIESRCQCDQADNWAQTFRRTNISRLLAHFFAQHKQFPCVLRDCEDEYERVGTALANWLGKEAEEAFAEARFGAAAFGTGHSAELATFEHIFLEYPAVFSREVREYGEKPRFWGAKREQ